MFVHLSGIYCIRNTVSGRVYVGSAVSVKRRWNTHQRELACGQHYNKALQRSWVKHGKDKFEFCVLEAVPVLADLIAREQYWIDALSAFHPTLGFNMSPTAGSPLGFKHTPDTRKRMSESGKGKFVSEETRAAISRALKGRPVSPETLAGSIAARKGKKFGPLSPEHRASVSAALKGRQNLAARGQPLSPAHRAGISAALKGRAKSPEHLAAMSAARTGKPQLARRGEKRSPEARAAMSTAQRGKVLSPEHIAALTAGRRRAAEKRAAGLSPHGPHLAEI